MEATCISRLCFAVGVAIKFWGSSCSWFHGFVISLDSGEGYEFGMAVLALNLLFYCAGMYLNWNKSCSYMWGVCSATSHKFSHSIQVCPCSCMYLNRNKSCSYMYESTTNVVFPPFQNICRFDFSRFIYFAMYLDICHI